MSKALSLLLSLSLLGSVLFPITPARAEGDVLVDEFEDTQIATEVTGNFEKWPAGNANTGTTIWGNANGATGSSVVYEAQAGKCFTSLSLTVDYHAAWSTELDCVTVEAKTKDGADWEARTLERGEDSALKGEYQQLKMTASLPDNTVSVRVTMTNGAATWTVWLDRLELSMAELPTEPDPDPTPTPTPTPTAEPEENQSTDSLLVDNFVTTVTVASQETGNFQKFNLHPDTGTGVWGNNNGATGSSVTYTAPEGKRFESLSLTVDYFLGYVDPGTSLTVEAQVSGGEEWTQVALAAGEPQFLATDTSGKTINLLTFTANLPENTVGVKVTMLNDVAWTLFLDRLEMPIAALPTEPDPGPTPTPTAEPEENQSTDSLLVDNFVTTVTVASQETGNFQKFNPHPDTGTGVWGNNNGAAGSGVTYTAPAGKRFERLALTVDYFDTWVNPGTSLTVEAQVSGGEDWTQVALTAGEAKFLATSGDKTINLLTFTASLPENTVGVKVTMTNDVGWTLFLDRLEMPMADLASDPDPAPEAEPEVNQSTDSLLVDNFVKTVTVASEVTGNFDRFNPHTDTGTGVWGQAGNNAQSSVAYAAPAGKRFQSLSLTVDYFKDYVNPGNALKAEALVSGGDWTQVALTAGEAKLLATTSAGQAINLQTFTADLPQNTVSVRVTMLNDVAWTLFLDRLEMPIAALEQETAPRPGAAAESPLVDDFLSVGKASETEGEFSQFDPHPDTGTSVWGQTNNYSQSSLIYRVAEEETYFRDLALTVDYFDGYLQPASSLRVEVRKDGDTSWSAVSLSGGPSSHLATTAGGLEVKKMTFSAQLPWGSKEVKVTMLNDVAWTLFLDRLEMNLGETSREVPFEGLAIGDLAAEREGTFAWGTIPAEGETIRAAVCTDGENGKGALIYNAGNDRDSISGVTLRTYRRDGADPAEIFTVLAQTKGSTAFREIPAVTGTTRNARRSQLLNVATSALSPCVLHYTPPENTVSVKVIVPVAGEEDAAYLTGISLAMSAQTQTQPSDGGGSSSSQGKGNSAVKEQEKEAAGWTGDRLTDEFAQDKQVANEVAGEFSQFDPHPDTGTSVWGLTNNYTQGSLTYHAKEGRVFNDISLTVNYFVGYVDLATALAVEVQGNDEKTWHPVSLETREEKHLNTTPAGLELNTLTYGARLPKGAAKLRITMRNDVAWTVFLDRLELNTVEPSAQTDAPDPAEPLPSEETPKPVEDLPTEPEPAASTVGVMTDELTDFSKMAAHTENLQLFEAHPETGGSVIGRLDTASESSMTYAAPEGAYIQALLLGTQYYPEFVDFSRDISVMVLQEGKTNWKKASFTAGQARDIPGFESGAFKNNELTVQIPDRVVKARIEFLNDVAWTVFLDRVALTTGVEETVPASLKTEPAKQLAEKAAGTAAKAPVETAPVETTGEPPAETLTESPEKTPAEAPTEAPTEAPQEPAEAVEEVPTEEVPLASSSEAWQNNVLWWVAALAVLAASGTLVYMDRRKKRGES